MSEREKDHEVEMKGSACFDEKGSIFAKAIIHFEREVSVGTSRQCIEYSLLGFLSPRMNEFSDELHGMIYPRARALTLRELYKEVLISVDSDAR